MWGVEMNHHVSLDDKRSQNLVRLFKPRSIAVLGASEQTSKVGGRPLAMLKKYGYAGKVYPINPKYAEVQGWRCYGSLADLPEVPDLVAIAVPAAHVVAAIETCARLGVGAAIIFTSGFGEMGTAGRSMEAQLRRIATETGLMVCGPNCQGIANFFDGAVVNFSSALGGGLLKPGNVGIVAQSGMFGGLIIAECLRRGLGVGYLVSSGNEAGMLFSDAVDFMASDPAIKVIAGYLEAIRDIDAFRRAAAKARRNGKVIVILKVGRSPGAAAVAASHTGSLAGAAELYDAALTEMGVLLVDSLEELVDTTVACAQIKLPVAGRRVGILTNSGGLGVFSADEVDRQDLVLAQFDARTVEKISEKLPEFGASSNPVDITIQALTEVDSVGANIRLIAEDPNVDAVIVALGLQYANVERLCDYLVEIAATSEKPLIVGWVSSDEAGGKRLARESVPIFEDPARALRALRRLVEFSDLLRKDEGAACAELPAGVEVALSALFARAQSAGQLVIGEADLRNLLQSAGIGLPQLERASDPDEAMRAYERFGGARVVVKIDSDDIAHKSDIGGVRLGIASASAAREATLAVLEAAREHAPGARIRGVTLSEMVEDGIEVIVGAKRDPALGPFVMVGLGGVLVEALKDVAFCPAPIDEVRALALLKSLRGFPTLTAFRGRTAKDVEAAAVVVAAVSRLIAARPEILEIDLNPVLVRDVGKGAVAVDALMHIAPV